MELTVLDNGQGIASRNHERAPGFGLIGMRERVALLGGTVRVGPEPGHGWRVTVMFSLKHDKDSTRAARDMRWEGA